jgi:hypothetical protein
MGIANRAREEYREAWRESAESNNSALGFALLGAGVLVGWLFSLAWGVVGWPIGILVGMGGLAVLIVLVKVIATTVREYRAMRRRLAAPDPDGDGAAYIDYSDGRPHLPDDED